MYYTTPKRRHSSLFQRMENEIKKISKKLSAAKQSYKGSSAKPKFNHFNSYNSIQQRPPPTVRKQSDSIESMQNIKSNTLHIRRRFNQGIASQAQTVNFDRHILQRETSTNNANKIILKLQDQNLKLSHKLGKIQQVCQDQSYKLGYLKAELKQTSRKLEAQKEKQFKQACYLTTLLQYYKKKATKYKKIVKQNSAVSIEVGSDQS